MDDRTTGIHIRDYQGVPVDMERPFLLVCLSEQRVQTAPRDTQDSEPTTDSDATTRRVPRAMPAVNSR